MDCEVLLPHIGRRGRNIMRAMIEAAPAVGVRCLVTQAYKGRAPLLMSYGLGHAGRRSHTLAHVARGGRLIGWDMGYWDRAVAMRCTVDRDHIRDMPDMPGDRWEATGMQLGEDFNPDGPVILIGIGRKSREQFGLNGQEWELRKLAEIRKAYPCRRVLYRPKKPETLAGCDSVEGEIADVLRGASLVVCRHSNVGVDACIAGIPAVCEDGAAASLYGSDLRHPETPDKEQRLRFLQNLAWWNWKPTEAASAWRFLLKVCG